jgi:hypothetical protein
MSQKRYKRIPFDELIGHGLLSPELDNHIVPCEAARAEMAHRMKLSLEYGEPISIVIKCITRGKRLLRAQVTPVPNPAFPGLK